jgi:hypothetical protein
MTFRRARRSGAHAEQIGRDGYHLLAAIIAPSAPIWLREVPAVWIRDLLGVSDNLEGVGQSVWIRRLEAAVGEPRLSGRRRCTTCSGEAPLSTRWRLLL